MPGGFKGLLDFAGYPAGKPGAVPAAAGFKGLLDFIGYSVGKGAAFPQQFAGLRVFYGASMKELSLVAEADAPSGMGGVLKIRKGATTFAVYLVETTDPNASSVRVRTTTGTKALRLKT